MSSDKKIGLNRVASSVDPNTGAQAVRVIGQDGTGVTTTDNTSTGKVLFDTTTTIVDEHGAFVNPQNPLSVDSYSIYPGDIDVIHSDIGEFTGEITDFFNDYHYIQTAISVSAGGKNPKSFRIKLKRPILTTLVGVISPDVSISNAKLTLISFSGAIVKIIDYSSEDVKRPVQLFEFEQKTFGEFLFEFFTDDEVNISGIGVAKSHNMSIDAISGIVCKDNSTEIPLGPNEVFTGEAVDTKNYGIVLCSVYSDVSSATDGLHVAFSSDKINWYWSDRYTIVANTGKTFTIQTQARYLRVEYTNGADAQSIFSLQVTLKPMYIKPSSHRIQDKVSGQDDAELITSIIKIRSNNDVDEFTNIDVQNPIPADGDSVYGKDLLIELSNPGDFILPSKPSAISNEILVSLVSDVYVDKHNTTANNPKIITLAFARPVSSSSFGIDGGTGDFSNVKVILYQGAYSEVLIDESLDNTKYQVRLFDIPPVRFSKLSIEFHTTDIVTIGLIGIFKTSDVAARIQALQDNGTVVNVSSTNQGNLKIALQEYGDTPSIDPFDRLRVSQPFTIFDSKQLHDKQPLFWDESLGGSATSVHSPANANVLMSVTASATDYVIRQTKQRFNYQPGKGMLIFMTFLVSDEVGVKKRVGIFDGTGVNYLDPNNGIFFENYGGDLSFNIAKNGSITETVPQSNWNVDTLDGTGASNIILDTAATHILIIDYEWLGVGRVRVGFVIDGIIKYCHYFNHANISSFNSVYMSTPNLALRYSIESDGTGSGSMSHICSTVMSEGGVEKTGILRSSENATAFVAGYGTNKYALIGIRLKSAYKDISVIPESINLVLGTNDAFKWEVHLNPTVNGTFTYLDKLNSAVQEAKGTISNTLSADGLILAAGGGSTSARGAESSLQTALRIGTTISGVADTLVLVIRPFSSNVSVWGCMNYRELL